MDEKNFPRGSKADTFGTYLETVQRGLKGTASPADEAAPRGLVPSDAMTPTAPAPASGTSGDDMLKILDALADRGPLKLPALLEATGMDVSRLMASLRDMCDLGLVLLPGTSGREAIEITGSGAEMKDYLRGVHS